jgi:PTS system nitrogen regulatory IIA component
MEEPASKMETSLAQLFRRGAFFYGVPGSLPGDVLTWLVNALPLANRDDLLKAVLEREELMSTAIGNGIALPHPRNPVIENEEDQFAVLGFLESEVDWNALDGQKVGTVILIASASPRLHLASLRRITFFCRDEGFCALLKARASKEEILSFIEKTEALW